MKLNGDDAPVSIQTHHEVLRFVENAVMAELKQFEHVWLPVGTRVSYALIDDYGAVVSERRQLECGYVEPLDEAPVVEVSEEEWRAIVSKPSESDPLSIEFIDQLRDAVRGQLEASAGQPLGVAISGVLTGSLSLYGSGCYCSGSRMGYYRDNRLYCRTTRCY